MKLSPGRLARLCATVLLASVAAVVALPTSPAQAATGNFRKGSTWETGYTGTITVRNDLPWAISNWRVEFELSSPTTISDSWGATMTRSGTRYVFTKASWAPPLAARSSTSFGFVATGGRTDPVNCLVDGVQCGGTAPSRDIVAPQAPLNFRMTGLGSYVTYSWDASTDNVGVAGYHLFANGMLLATTTGTSHTTPVPPPMVYRYAVRGFDAAGNLSPLTYLAGPSPDRSPPSTPTALRIGPGAGYLQVNWNASTDNVRVAGYEIYLNGTLVTAVEGTTAWVPYRGYGTYMVDVRAFDASGNFSDRARTGIAIDPPPPAPSTPPTPPAR
jgi:hypothetical protein